MPPGPPTNPFNHNRADGATVRTGVGFQMEVALVLIAQFQLHFGSSQTSDGPAWELQALVTFIENGFLGRYGSGKEFRGGLVNHGYPFPPSLITAIAGIQQEETKVNPRGILLSTSSLGRACPGPGLARLG